MSRMPSFLSPSKFQQFDTIEMVSAIDDFLGVANKHKGVVSTLRRVPSEMCPTEIFHRRGCPLQPAEYVRPLDHHHHAGSPPAYERRHLERQELVHLRLELQCSRAASWRRATPARCSSKGSQNGRSETDRRIRGARDIPCTATTGTSNSIWLGLSRHESFPEIVSILQASHRRITDQHHGYPGSSAFSRIILIFCFMRFP
ncbi:hypothetical protein B0H10DRAFT_405483 [Mycena sp. CBHHK59/15]|nr:hypothetical protein B0H10DRAFT_405483 [Mycena sp. CBHHK59/15]